MIPVVTTAQMRALEEGSERLGVSTAQLMENAGAALAAQARPLVTPGGGFLVVCGPGNNGGDGMVAALRLAEAGERVAVWLVGDPERLKGEPRRHFEAVGAAGLLVERLLVAEVPAEGGPADPASRPEAVASPPPSMSDTEAGASASVGGTVRTTRGARSATSGTRGRGSKRGRGKELSAAMRVKHGVAGEGDVVIDAVFGTGLNRAPTGQLAGAIRRINAMRAAGAKVVSADIPSGLPSDGGPPFEPCVRADVTVAFGAAKLGEVLGPGVSACGSLEVVGIGIPQGAGPAADVELLDEPSVRALVPERPLDSHKGLYGHVLVIAGGPGKTGAAALASIAALRAGAGLVTVATRTDALPWIQLQAPELMGVGLEARGPLGRGDLEALLAAAEKKSVLVIGPGIPRGPETAALLGELLAKSGLPAVLDADALNAIAEDLPQLKRARAPLVLTPHPGEMARLCGCSNAEVQADRFERARAFAKAHGVVLLLKGARSLIAAPDGRVRVNPTGNPGMSTGGTGDVLSGVIGALIAQGLETFDAASVGAYVHGLAGDLEAHERGQMGLLASDLFDGLGRVWSRWGR